MKKILRFTASWCGPCKALAASLEKADIGVPIEVVDIDVHTEVAREYRIRSVPTLILLDGEKELTRLVGSKTIKEIQDWAK